MKKTFLVFRNALMRSRLVMLCAFLGGLLLCYVFTLMAELVSVGYGGIPIGFLAHEETAVTKDLRAYLSREVGMVITESDDIDMLHTELVERHIAGVIEVPAGFEKALLGGDAAALQVSFLDDYANAAFLQGYLESYTGSVSILALGAAGDAGTLASLINESAQQVAPIEKQSADGNRRMLLTQQNAFRQIMGFFLMFCFLLTFSTSLQLFGDRQSGLYDRVKASSVRTVQYLLGILSMGFVNAVLLISPFFVYVHFTGPNIGMHISQAIVLCLEYALFAISAALVVSLYLASRNAITAAIVGAATILCILGGAYFPIDTSPQLLQNMARITPQFWFMDAVNKLQEDPSAAWWQNALAIGLFALLLFILAGIRFVSGGSKRRAV